MMDKFLSNPRLPTVNPEFKGNKIVNDRFTNAPWPDTDSSLFKVLKWFFMRNPQREEKKRDPFKLETVRDHSIFETKEDVIVWLGHSTFFIRAAGINILTDPVTGNIPFIKRHVEFPVPVSAVKNIDLLLLSHGHRDHFDVPSLRKIMQQNPDAVLLGPLGIEKLLKDEGLKNKGVQEAAWYQQFQTSGIKCTLLPALHWYKRGLNDFNKILWGSFMIDAGGKKIFFAGDTAYGSHFKDIRKVMGEAAICLLPIGAYKPAFMMNRSHTNPVEAISAFKDLGGKYFIPMHYGTFDLADEPLGEPISWVRENLGKEILKELKPGEKFYLKNI